MVLNGTCTILIIRVSVKRSSVTDVSIVGCQDEGVDGDVGIGGVQHLLEESSFSLSEVASDDQHLEEVLGAVVSVAQLFGPLHQRVVQVQLLLPSEQWEWANRNP